MFGFKELLSFLHWAFIRPIKLNISLGGLALGGGLSLAGSLLGADAQRDAARAAAEAARFRGIDITSGLGTVSPIMSGKEVTGFTTELSPELQALRERLLGIGGTGLEQFQTFDPVAAGQLFTGQLNQLAAPQEEQQRLNLENRLFSQGLLGATTGANRMEALNTAQALAQNQRNLQGFQYGTGEQQRLFQNALSGIQGATTLDQLLANQLSQSIGAGGRITAANQAAAAPMLSAGMNRADAISGFFGQLGQGLTNMAFSDPAPYQGNLFTTPGTGFGIQESTPVSNPFFVDIPRL